MVGFEEGYSFFEKNTGSAISGIQGSQYVGTVNQEIDSLVENLNAMQGFKTDVSALKGDVAEFWHSGTFNIDAALKGSSHRAFVDRSHDFASTDVSTNFGENYGLKYYKTGADSAKQQAKSIFERFKEYQASGGKDGLDDFLAKRGFSDDSVLSDPIYSGQMRLIPSDQMVEATKWLERKIAEEVKRPEQIHRYRETLDLLKSKIEDNQGNQSIPLTKAEAEKLARLAKEGGIDPSKLGLTTEELMRFEYVLKQSFKAGLTAATITMVIKVAPEIIKAVEYLIKHGEVDPEQLKRVGFDALSGASEGFVRGTVSAALTTCCKSGLLGNALKSVDPTIIGSVTVLVMDVMKNSYKVATGKMSRYEMANELIKEMFTSTCALALGAVGQAAFVEVPVLGFMLGSFVGSLAGAFIYQVGYKPVISFCIDTGFTMFGLVDQNYELPDDVLKEIGVDVFEYEKFDYSRFEPTRFDYQKFEAESFDADRMDITFLRRGVIGVSQIGYI